MLAVKDNITSKLIGKHSSLEAIVVSVLCNNKEITICLLYVTGFHITRLPHTQNQTYVFTRNGLPA